MELAFDHTDRYKIEFRFIWSYFRVITSQEMQFHAKTKVEVCFLYVDMDMIWIRYEYDMDMI